VLSSIGETMKNVIIVFTLQLKETRTKGNWIRKANNTNRKKKERTDRPEISKG